MSLEHTKVPLTRKEFDTQRAGFCAGCGCGCGYILYLKNNEIADLYGHPADPRGVGSFCSKGLTYIQEISQNPLRLKGVFYKRDEPFEAIAYKQAIEILKENLHKGRTAFLLGREAGLEEYLLAKSITDDVFVDAPVVEFIPSTVHPTRWKEARFILSLDAEPVFSEVMSTRWIIDAVEAGAYLFCLSSRYETLCAKAKKRKLLKPDLMIEFMQELLEPEKKDEDVEFVKRSFFLLRGSLVLVGASLLNSPFGERLLYILAQLRRKYGINYSFVGDLMPFPAKSMEELFNKLEEFDNFVIVGNLLRYFTQDQLDILKGKFVVSFQVFPNLTAHYSNLIFANSMFFERDFMNYRHGFGYLIYSPKTMSPMDGMYNPYYVLSEAFDKRVSLEAFLSEIGIDLNRLKDKGEEPLKAADLKDLELSFKETPKGKLFLYTDSTLVEDLGHWNPWTHEMEKYQRAYINPKTAREFSLGDRVEIGGITFELHNTENIAEGVLFVPLDYEEFQPFDPGYRVGAFAKKPYHRYEVLV
ncbi:MAG: dehydrogenase [Aquificaceae bacterium]